MEKINTPDDVKELIQKWRDFFDGDLLFGHLDIVREESSDNLYVVDPGSFPEFTNWKCSNTPVEIICNLIINKYRKMKKN